MSAESVRPTSCDTPSPLVGVHDAEYRHYVIVLAEGVDAGAEITRLERRWGFTATTEWPDLRRFSVWRIDPRLVAALRCGPNVSRIERNEHSIPIVG